jgi:hypothetical protein
MRVRAMPNFALAVALVAGCARPPVPDAIGLPSGTAAPPADPRAIPSAPAEALERIASIEREGVRLTIELERNPLPADEPTWLTTTVANTGPDELRWITDACDIDVSVYGVMLGQTWRSGRSWADATVESYKQWALESARIADGAIRVEFTPEPFVGRDSELVCADVGIEHAIAPGASESERAQWDGAAARNLGTPPGGIVALTASFGLFWRAADGEFEAGEHPKLEVPLDAWIEGAADAPRIQPAEAVDIALADQDFGEWLLQRPFRDGVDWYIRYVADEDAWHVSIQAWPNPPARLAVIDAQTGLLREVRGRS